MTGREQAVFIFIIWLCVYPSVLLFTWGFDWLGIDVAMWLEILISTALSVPLISLVAAPKAEGVIAKVRGVSQAELKLEQARQAEGPSPEELVKQ